MTNKFQSINFNNKAKENTYILKNENNFFQSNVESGMFYFGV